ncbi:enoyl-[acyl-carrier-protein] reductase FabV [Alkalibaculum sp. M08DMB]|uniref:Trans-2-enoyl-CoA reductase [NADH] n=1 Tax=Alkalibaculum sporogenes TaxID=2655001 RepID=A0A6A7KA07_9FIRM|nr:enoyl-ACP reductase FabV [Alkalibaculum sporogenes]MPW26379.1 enoyl-[acyl-carrier-protein] reductase FabV [Alkalibaculum sporogenes]
MIIKPVIKNNICIRVHPLGCKENVKRQIEYVESQESFKGPKNVLIIGGSSGYGLASRISLGFGCKSNTINVSFEVEPKKNKTGTAGWWNNVYFQHYAKKAGLKYKDFVGDAFSLEMKDQVMTYIKKEYGKIDLLIYSLASNRRTDPYTGETYISTLKSINKEVKGYTIDINNELLKEEKMEAATPEEIQNTIKVMGGEDWKIWIDMLDEADLLNEGFKTVAYTYLGSPATYEIYHHGTIGMAKNHLDETAAVMNPILKKKYNGEALISASKAIVTKASVYIPIFPVYGAILYKLMKEAGTHEGEIEQKYRLFKDMIYGEQPIIDEVNRLRPDNLEQDEQLQEKVKEILANINNENLHELSDIKGFISDFMKINGFDFENVDYNEDVDMDALSEIELI